jgi:hypothetical protein
VHRAVGDEVAAVRLGVEQHNAAGITGTLHAASLPDPTAQCELLSRLLVLQSQFSALLLVVGAPSGGLMTAAPD